MNKHLPCLTEGELTKLHDGELDEEKLERYEAHVTVCEICRDSLERLDDQHSHTWRSEVCPALMDVFHEASSPNHLGSEPIADPQSFLHLLGPSDDPNMLGRVGNYEVVGVIGHGGMGVVFKALDSTLDRFVAIKMMLPQLSANGTARQRFLREAKAAAAVVDDHVLPIFGVDQWQGTPYLVMQYSSGRTLDRRIEDEGALKVQEILRIALQTAKGLAAAHAQTLQPR